MTRHDAAPEDDGLETWFGPARAARPAPPAALMTAILDDAARMTAARGRAVATAPTAPAPRFGAWLTGLLGTGGAATLTACALAGFLVGASGLIDWAREAAWTDADPVSEFFDMAEAN